MKRAGRSIGARARRNVYPYTPANSLTTSLSAYNAAAANSWVLITQTEYNSMAAVSGVSKYAQSDYWLTNGAVYNLASFASVMDTQNPIPANRYPFALAVKNANGTSQLVQVKIEGNSPSGLVQLGTDITTPATGGTLYYVLKGYTLKTTQSCYLAGYFQDYTATFYQYGSGVSVRYADGNVSSLISVTPEADVGLNMQILAMT